MFHRFTGVILDWEPERERAGGDDELSTGLPDIFAPPPPGCCCVLWISGTDAAARAAADGRHFDEIHPLPDPMVWLVFDARVPAGGRGSSPVALMNIAGGLCSEGQLLILSDNH
jgi:hypothetical protein